MLTIPLAAGTADVKTTVDENGHHVAHHRVDSLPAISGTVGITGTVPVSGTVGIEGTVPVSVSQPSEYETVPASQTDQMLGAGGAVGDTLEGLLCVVATAATSQVQIKDGGNTAITVLPNNVPGVGSYPIPLGMRSMNGGWQITTAAGVSVIAMGEFT